MCWLLDLVIVTKSAIQEIWWQKWEGVNLLEDLVAVTQISKEICQEICWQKLCKSKYTGIFSDCHHI